MVRILIRVVAVVALLGVAYLAAINIILNLPATQTLLNRTQGGRTVFAWDRAWSIVPFRVHVTGLTINGQSWSQQFEITAPWANAAIDVPALFSNTIRFADMHGADLAVRFRPRPRPDRDDSALRQFYPEIPGRDPTLEAEAAPTPAPGSLMIFEIASLTGSNDIWLGANRMTLTGEASAVVRRQNRHGPMAIDDGVLDLAVGALNIGGKPVSNGGTLKGSFGMTSFIPQQNRGVKILEFLRLDADVDLPVDGIDFLNDFLDSVADMTVGGSGRIEGRIAYRNGTLVPGADFSLAAENLRVDLPPYAVRGAGSVVAKVDEDSPGTMQARLSFSTIDATHEPDDQTLFNGADIGIDVTRSSVIFPVELREEVPRSVTMSLPSVAVPDVSVYQRYLPDEWNVQILGGSGSLLGTAAMSRNALDFDLTLHSDEARIRITDKDFQSSLTLGVKATGTADATSARLDVGGTFVELDDSLISDQAGGTSSPWQTRFAISAGAVDFALPSDQDENTGIVGFWSLFRGKELKAMLSEVDGTAQGKLTVSDLDWVSFLFREPFSLQIAKTAEVDADLTIAAGRLTTASFLRMPPTDFTLGILDYIVHGTGGFDLSITKSAAKPDVRLLANLTGASLRLQDEKVAVVEEVTLTVDALAEEVTPKDGGAARTVEMAIPSAKITDLTAYNAYLPANTPIRILRGTAGLSARLVMSADNATGFMRMTTSRVDADVMGDRISGIIGLDVAIPSGSAEQRRFDIAGSKLRLDDVQVTGRKTTNGWSGRVDIGRSNVVWKRPMTLDMDATVYMKDARPILEIFDANRRDNKWLDRLLNLQNVNGRMTIAIEPRSIVIPYAFATSDSFDVGAKGIFGASGSQGVFYARTGKLAGILAIDQGRKKFELIDATRKFDDYRPGGPVPGIHDTGRTRTEASAAPQSPPGPATKPKKPPFSLFKRRR